MRIAVIDGQGGGIGRVITERLVRALPPDVEILALGTNATATAGMLKAGANEGASGENAVIYNAGRVDLIIGPLGVVCAHAFLGEMTPAMAEAVAGSRAKKILLPLNRSNVELVGVSEEPLPHLVEKLVARVQRYLATG
ncbi:MAG TPA: DUF3842 family protein [Spirochaetia bacterium]|nr:DUF3842 family protein [Spirochaetia bacterium]